MDYVQELVDGFENLKTVDKFDALISILGDRVERAMWSDTVDEIQPLADQLRSLYYSVYSRHNLHDNDYNAPVELGELTERQRAYFHGYFAAQLDLVNGVLAKRPTQADIDVIKNNLVSLSEVNEFDEILYCGEIHDELIEAGALYKVPYSMDPDKKHFVVKLTPFGRDSVKRFLICG